jgi:hypothetical protein
VELLEHRRVPDRARGFHGYLLRRQLLACQHCSYFIAGTATARTTTVYSDAIGDRFSNEES